MRKRRSKNEPTKGDKQAQAYRNRAAMHRVHESAMLAIVAVPSETIRSLYWTPRNIDEFLRMRKFQ